MTGWKKIEGNTIPGNGEGGKTVSVELEDATLIPGDFRVIHIEEGQESDIVQRLALALSETATVLEMTKLQSLSPLVIDACLENANAALAAYRGKAE